MRLETDAIVCALRPHGEHGAVVRLMTAGARASGRLCPRRAGAAAAAGPDRRAIWSRPSFRARTETQLPQAVIELVHSRGTLAVRSRCRRPRSTGPRALTATVLPEGQPYPRIYPGARRPARRDRGGAVGERLGRGAGALRAAATRRTRIRARPRAAARSRARTTIWSRSARDRAGRQRGRGRALCRETAAACRPSFAKAGAHRGRKSLMVSISPAIS